MNLFKFEQFEMTNSQTENTVGGKRGKRSRQRRGTEIDQSNFSSNNTCTLPTVTDVEVEAEIEQLVLEATTMTTDLEYQLLEAGQQPTAILTN